MCDAWDGVDSAVAGGRASGFGWPAGVGLLLSSSTLTAALVSAPSPSNTMAIPSRPTVLSVNEVGPPAPPHLRQTSRATSCAVRWGFTGLADLESFDLGGSSVTGGSLNLIQQMPSEEPTPGSVWSSHSVMRPYDEKKRWIVSAEVSASSLVTMMADGGAGPVEYSSHCPHPNRTGQLELTGLADRSPPSHKQSERPTHLVRDSVHRKPRLDLVVAHRTRSDAQTVARIGRRLEL